MTWGSTRLSLAVTDLAQVVLTLGLEVEGGHVIQAQGQAPGGGDVLEQSPRQALAVASLLGSGQGAEQGPGADRLQAQVTQDTGDLGLRGRLDQARQNHLLKRPITPSGVPQPQTGVDRLDGLDQPARPTGDDRRPSHRTTITRLMTGRLAPTVERRPQIQDLLTRQKPLVPQVHQSGQLSLVMS